MSTQLSLLVKYLNKETCMQIAIKGYEAILLIITIKVIDGYNIHDIPQLVVTTK